MADISFKIVEEIGVLSELPNNWQKELNRVSWNERDAKYDLRDWNADHQKMRKGITLTVDELIQLKEILNELDL